MKPAVTLAVIFLSLLTLLHALRLFFQVSLTIGGEEMPMWASVIGVIVPGGLAFWICREQKR